MDKYFDDYNPDLLPLIPPNARMILEVGCGTGKLAEAYRRVNPGVTWWAAEKNREAANLAERRGIKILCCDIETVDVTIRSCQNVDCLIFGDVLEHLIEPWTVLKKLVPFLLSGAQVLASIPNVGHWSVILNLLRGQWCYEDKGLLDRSHLRFFTLESIKEMFRDAGLQTFEIRGRQLGFNAEAEAVRDKLLASGLGETFGGPEFARQALVYQYLVRAIRSEAPVPRLHIHAIGDGTICERPRLHEPMAALATIPGVRCTANCLTGAPDIIIQQRLRRLDVDIQRKLVENGTLLIAEIDDDPEWLKGLPECNFLPLRAVHAIQTTTEVMAETCREFCPHVAVFPNQIAELPPPRNHANENHSIRIFFGALNRENDWAPIMPTLNRVLAECSDVIVHVVHDRAFFNALETGTKMFHPFCQWEEYRRILHTCDIALLPLEDNRVNRHKSDIKFIECAAEGVVAVCSETIYGRRIMQSGGAGRWHMSVDGFEDNLRSLINSADERQRIAAQAYAYVRDHRLLSQHYRHRHDVYTHWLNRRSELTRDLLERVPELRSAPAPDVPQPALEASPA